MKRIATFFALFLILSLPLSFIAFAGPIPDTGQTRSYTDTFGEDSDYSINPQSYTKLDAQGNGLPDTAASWIMVRDNVTGLIWEVKTDDGTIHDKDNQYNWQNAQAVFIKELNDNNFGGFSDWRMPTVKELTQIVHRDMYKPAINTDYFPNTIQASPPKSSGYWSSTTIARFPDDAWAVSFHVGIVSSGYNKSNSYYVRAVRGGYVSSSNLIINDDGTVTDTSTGLMWQQETAGPMNWEDALNYCESLTLAGYEDWRLPNINELQSIVDYSTYNPAIDVNAFPNTMSEYWSSTTLAANPVAAWQVLFGMGAGNDGSIEYTVGYKLNSNFYVRAVRSMQVETCEADFDGDGDVDGSDLAVFAADFGRTDCPVSQTQSLKSENSLLKREIERLKAENAVLKKENEKLTP